MTGLFDYAASHKWGIAAAALTLVLADFWWNGEGRASRKRIESAKASDPGLFGKYSSYRTYTTSRATYPRIRTFYKEHYEASKLPEDLPLLVLMHGLGGSASQFTPLLTSLVNIAPTLAIDLPGCGLSDFDPSDPRAYSTHALAELLATAISEHQDAENNQRVVLISHSMGCSISALLASSTSPLAHLLANQIAAMIALCPISDNPTPQQERQGGWLSMVPIPVFDLFRLWEGRGGTQSASITRMVGLGADEQTRKLQRRYNQQSQSHVFLHMFGSMLGSEGLPGRDIWSGVKVPLFLVAGEADTLTPAHNVENITDYLTSAADDTKDSPSRNTAPPPMPVTSSDVAGAEEVLLRRTAPPRTVSGMLIKEEQTTSKHSSALKMTIFPSPTSHALPYATGTVRILAGLIENFLTRHVDKRLGHGWQLQHLTTSGKWEVKNLEKWQAVEACSVPIGGLFRAMKTMREVDDEHSPTQFVKHFGVDALDDGLAVVIDISHESPVYSSQALEDAGVNYHKFPTVSKQVPRAEDVDRFVSLIDDLRTKPAFLDREDGNKPTVGVHCHYGYNRTGFFIVCYLVERLGYKLEDAIDEFAQKRPPRGIKHEYFIDELHVRYAVQGLTRRSTVLRE